ncbi:hypothetical protein ABF87_03665 [Nitrosomonas sp. JL21]|nr:hypothetical protein [Nitrosomonas sp. JL21]
MLSLLRVNEAPLTGESQSVEKHYDKLVPETLLAEQKNTVFLGANIVSGSSLLLSMKHLFQNVNRP